MYPLMKSLYHFPHPLHLKLCDFHHHHHHRIRIRRVFKEKVNIKEKIINRNFGA
jgi:hypothetical protein